MEVVIASRNIVRFEARGDDDSKRLWIHHKDFGISTIWLSDAQAMELWRELAKLVPAKAVMQEEDAALDKWAEEHAAEFTHQEAN